MRSLRRLGRAHTLGIAILTALVLTSQVLLQVGFGREDADAPLINVAGRQRMLSQRISKVALLLEDAVLGGRDGLRLELAQALSDWLTATKKLRAAAESMSQEESRRNLLRDLDTVETFQGNMASAGFRLIEVASQESDDALALSKPVKEILENEPQFLKAMEATVKDFERAAKVHVSQVRSLSLVLCVVTLLMLVFQLVIVFEPTFRAIRRQFTALAAAFARQDPIDVPPGSEPAVLVVGSDSVITWASPTCERLFGVVRGKPVSALFAKEDTARDSITARTALRPDGSGFATQVWAYQSGTSTVLTIRPL